MIYSASLSHPRMIYWADLYIFRYQKSSCFWVLKSIKFQHKFPFIFNSISPFSGWFCTKWWRSRYNLNEIICTRSVLWFLNCIFYQRKTKILKLHDNNKFVTITWHYIFYRICSKSSQFLDYYLQKVDNLIFIFTQGN